MPKCDLVTVVGDKKVTKKVPLKEKLEYNFRKIEDDMIFKMALTAGGDLVGFIYLEIPHKFKSMREFIIEDQFPVKQLETDPNPEKGAFFTAKIKIEYKATRKLDVYQIQTGKLPAKTTNEQLSKSLKERLKEIHEQIDHQHDEGFKFLHNFEMTLLKKKEEAKEREKKKIPVPKIPQKQVDLNRHKNDFYQDGSATRGEKEKSSGDKTVAVLDLGNDKTVGFEALVEELTHTRKEYVTTSQKIKLLEDDRYRVDNDALKKKLEAKIADLMRDKREIGLKLSEQGTTFEIERKKLAKETADKKQRLEMDIKELEERLGILRTRTKTAGEEIEKFSKKEQEI